MKEGDGQIKKDSVRALFYVIGNSLEFPITQKGTNVPMMRTRAKQKHVASDRACRRENVPRHILFHLRNIYSNASLISPSGTSIG